MKYFENTSDLQIEKIEPMANRLHKMQDNADQVMNLFKIQNGRDFSKLADNLTGDVCAKFTKFKSKLRGISSSMIYCSKPDISSKEEICSEQKQTHNI